MFANGRKTIGVFISQIHEDYQSCLCDGISCRAKKLNYNVAFFTNYDSYGEVSYDIGEINIVNLPNYEDFDGIILATDIMSLKEMETKIIDNIKKNSKCPVVSVRKKFDDYYNILFDNNTILEDIIRHFIEIHGFTRINFLAGTKGYIDSEKRLESYKKILTEYHIPIEEERIYYGDFWKYCGHKAVNTFLESPLERPQAIVCANDYMAISVCEALLERGIKVPEDIAISGCDNIQETIAYSPAITTTNTPIFEMGVEAVEKIHKHIIGEPQDNTTYFKTNTIYRESCGCKKSCNEEKDDNNRRNTTQLKIQNMAINKNAYLSIFLTSHTTLDEVDNVISMYDYGNEEYVSFYICLNEEWENNYGNQKQPFHDFTDNMILETGKKNYKVQNKVRFLKKDLLPLVAIEDKPQIIYFLPLHYQDDCLGYFAISVEKNHTFSQTFQTWLVNICNALENVRINSELNSVVSKLEDMYIRDALTGLYNRRGFDILAEKYLKKSIEDKNNLMFFTADMDDLKLINDKYGHANGDIAIKAIADALQFAADENEICMRCGGDEFTVVGMAYDEEKINKFTKKFLEAIDKFSKETGQDYEVLVSYGWNLVTPDETTNIEKCMNIADEKMYEQKYKKKSLVHKSIR